jgi:hypothetical protein
MYFFKKKSLFSIAAIQEKFSVICQVRAQMVTEKGINLN